MSETVFNIELRHGYNDKRWWYHSQHYSLNYAIKVAERFTERPTRIRKVVKTIVWKGKTVRT